MIMVDHNSWMYFMTQKDPNDWKKILESKDQDYNFGNEINKGEKVVAVDALLSLKIHLIGKFI